MPLLASPPATPASGQQQLPPLHNTATATPVRACSMHACPALCATPRCDLALCCMCRLPSTGSPYPRVSPATRENQGLEGVAPAVGTCWSGTSCRPEVFIQVLKRAGPGPWQHRRRPPMLGIALLLSGAPKTARSAAWQTHISSWLRMGVRVQHASLHAAAEAVVAMAHSV